MKKVILLVLILTCALVMISCASKPDETSDANIVSNKEPEIESVDALFKDNGYSTKCENVEYSILSGNQYDLFLDEDEIISIYRYDTSDAAQADAERVNEDGYSTDEIYIDWISVPHFFLHDNLIIQYTGTDEKIITILTDLCGEQFAGGGIDDVYDFS